MLDCELYGLAPGGHHLTNLIFHLANALVLFALLRRTTGVLWPSALVAALFAWHPLHVESVAWVSERKDVLSTFFGLLTLLAYVFYSRAPRAQRGTSLALSAFILSLASPKPMLVTLPFLLLLLDFWPLRRPPFDAAAANCVRDQPARIRLLRLVLEKVPFFGLSLVSCVVTFLVQKRGGALASMAHIPLGERAANAVVSYAGYLWHTVWPLELAAFYPHPLHWPGEKVFVALLVLLAGVGRGLSFPARVPDLGLVMVSGHPGAGDRAGAGRGSRDGGSVHVLAPDWDFRWRRVGSIRVRRGPPSWRRALQVLGACAGALLLLCTRFQLSHWKTSETLFRARLGRHREQLPRA